MSRTQYRLGEIAPFQYGKALPATKRKPGSVPVVSSGGITGMHDSALLSQPSIVIGRKGSIGSVYYLEEPCFPIDTAFYTQGTENVDLKYLYYLLTTLPLSKMNNDSAVPGLNRAQAEALKVSVPILAEQRAIAATLGALDDKIESNWRKMDIAQALGDALFTRASDQTSVLSGVAHIVMGSSPKGVDLNESGVGLPFYQGTRDFGARYPSLRIWTTAPVRVAKKNDTLMSVRAPVGEFNRASTDCCIGRGVAAISSVKYPSVLYYAMRASSPTWEIFRGEGTVFSSVTKTDVHSGEIPWIDDSRIDVVETKLRAIDALIECLSSQTTRLGTLRDTLLPELMSGRIRVPEAHKVIDQEVGL